MKLKRFANVVEGPMGFEMPEGVARRVEELAKGLPKDFSYRRAFKAVAAADFEFKPGPREDVSYITTDAPDREGDVLIPGGMDEKDYAGVVTWCHAYGPKEGWSGLQIGHNLWRKPKAKGRSNGIIAGTRYFTKPDGWSGDWLPDAIVHLQQQDPPALTGKSVGFLPLHQRTATREELAARPEWKGCTVIDKWALLEYAVCPIGVNQEAEIIAVGKAVIDPGSRDIISAACRDLATKSAAQPLTRETIVLNDPATTGGESTSAATSEGAPPAAPPEPVIDATPPPAPVTKSAGRHAHLDFRAPADVRSCMVKGMSQHGSGDYGPFGGSGPHDCATPEQLATAAHLAHGGKASPTMVRKIKAWHDGPGAKAHEHADGTPMHTLALLHGQAPGRAWAEKMCKDMGDGDGDEAPPAPVTKADVANESTVSDGGAVVPEKTGVVDADGDSMPACPKCKAAGKMSGGPVAYHCSVCDTAYRKKDEADGDMQEMSVKAEEPEGEDEPEGDEGKAKSLAVAAPEPFIRLETIRKAAERRTLEYRKNVGLALTAALQDEWDRATGKP